MNEFYKAKSGRPFGSFTVIDRTVKTCSKCGFCKPIFEFYGDNTRRDKKSAYCKPCKSEYSRKLKRKIK